MVLNATRCKPQPFLSAKQKLSLPVRNFGQAVTSQVLKVSVRMTLLWNCLAKQVVGNKPTWEPPIWIQRAPGLGSRLVAAHSGKEEIQLLEVQLLQGCMQTSLTGNPTTEAKAKTALSLGKATGNGATSCAQRRASSCVRPQPQKEERPSLQRQPLRVQPSCVPPPVTMAGRRLMNVFAIRSRMI